MRTLEVGAEKLVAGEILERTLDHGHGQVSFRREGPNYGLGLHRPHAEILARSQQEWQASVLVEGYAAELLVLRRREKVPSPGRWGSRRARKVDILKSYEQVQIEIENASVA